MLGTVHGAMLCAVLMLATAIGGRWAQRQQWEWWGSQEPRPGEWAATERSARTRGG
jgi:hypothetical protein